MIERLFQFIRANQLYECIIHMPKTKAKKAEIVEKLAEKIKRAKVLVFTSFSQRGKKGLNFTVMKKLKRTLKETDAEYLVFKKTLLGLALQKLSFSGEVKIKELDGSIALMLVYQDMIEPLKILHKFSKENKALLFYSGLNPEDKKIISKENLVELANLPSHEALFYRLAGAVRYPLSGLANVLQGNIRGLAIALSQIKR